METNFEVQFSIRNAQALVAVFAVITSLSIFSTANNLRHQETVNLTPGVTAAEENEDEDMDEVNEEENLQE